MALPTSGPLSISMIKAELGSSSNSLRTLSSLAGFSTPDAISEFYGYSPTPPSVPVTITNYLYQGYMQLLVGGDSQGIVSEGTQGFFSADVGSSIQAQANSDTFMQIDVYINGNYTTSVSGFGTVTTSSYVVQSGYTYEFIGQQ